MHETSMARGLSSEYSITDPLNLVILIKNKSSPFDLPKGNNICNENLEDDVLIQRY